MKFLASSEVYQPAGAPSERARRCVEPFLNAAFAVSSLSSLEATLRYLPIIMPEGMRDRYPPRSKLRQKDGTYDCCPQLDYGVFVSGAFEDYLREYVRGIVLSSPHLSCLGASVGQVEEFERIIATAVEQILAQQT